MSPAYQRPESVLVVIHSVDGQVLLLRRVRPAGLWQSVTGGLHWDETPAAAAARELREETGFPPDGLRDCHLQFRFPIVPPWRERYPPQARSNREHVFALPLPAPRPPRLHPTEHDAWQWLPRAEAARRVFSWSNRLAILRCVPDSG